MVEFDHEKSVRDKVLDLIENNPRLTLVERLDLACQIIGDGAEFDTDGSSLNQVVIYTGIERKITRRGERYRRIK